MKKYPKMHFNSNPISRIYSSTINPSHYYKSIIWYYL